MRKVAKLLAYFIVMAALLIFFMPKVNLYYALERLMKERNIYISDEQVYDQGFSLELEKSNVLFDKLSLAEIDTIKLSPWLFYNALSLDNIHVNEGFEDFLPQKISRVSIEHFIYNPTHISLRGDSEDSFFYGDVDLIERVITIHLRLGDKSEKKYRLVLQKLIKEEGGYLYEYKF